MGLTDRPGQPSSPARRHDRRALFEALLHHNDTPIIAGMVGLVTILLSLLLWMSTL